MLTDRDLRTKIDSLWDKMWTGGLSNPLDAIEQLSYLLFLKRLDEAEEDRERRARLQGEQYIPLIPQEMRWREWTSMRADEALKYMHDTVFPWLKTLGSEASSFQRYMENAEFKINKASLLIEACRSIDALQISEQNQDVQGDIYEYLLDKLKIAGRNGQFRTPRHIIRMMVQMVDPKIGERICDPAAGTCGFLVNAYQHILEANTSPALLSRDTDGVAHNLIGDRLTTKHRAFLQEQSLTGYDNDSGMTMLRIGSMNLMLHGIEHPRFFHSDVLSKHFTEERRYDVVLANPPFKGAVDTGDVSDTLPARCKKTELLFLHLFLRLLDMGGRCAAIVPEGVLFGSSLAHVNTRKKLVEDNRLEAVISMPSGVFKPYAGVSTAVLIFTKGGTSDQIWFYDMEHDGFSLDDKRQPLAENDIPDILQSWNSRHNQLFAQEREQRLSSLRAAIEPLKLERQTLSADINRLTFEAAIATTERTTSINRLESARTALSDLDGAIHPLQREFNQLSRQFWVPKARVKANHYELSASTYRPVEHDETYYDAPDVTLSRMRELEKVIVSDISELEVLLK
jgi:type I restriction enzyme M protein